MFIISEKEGDDLEVRCPSFQIPALATEEFSGRKYWINHFDCEWAASWLFSSVEKCYFMGLEKRQRLIFRV